jgi:hypothetical protein
VFRHQKRAKPIQSSYFKHHHLVPGVSPPIGIEVFAGLPAKAKIRHMRQVFQEVGSLRQNLLLEKIAEKEEPLALPFLVMVDSNFFLNITISYVVGQPLC